MHMPEYRVYEDQYAQGYVGVLKKNKRYKQYLNMISRPGGIRPIRKHPDGGPSAIHDHSRKIIFFLLTPSFIAHREYSDN